MDDGDDMLGSKKISYLAPLVMPVLLGACATGANSASPPVAHAEIVNASGQAAGTAVITQSDGGLVLKLDLSGLEPGVHGMHLHTTGTCEGPAFTSAGAHLNPHHKMHGSENPQGSHLGDLPNITVGPDGRATATVPMKTSAAELEAFLFDADGTAVVVHASPDDYRTDPSGNSGNRIACGVLRRG